MSLMEGTLRYSPIQIVAENLLNLLIIVDDLNNLIYNKPKVINPKKCGR